VPGSGTFPSASFSAIITSANVLPAGTGFDFPTAGPTSGTGITQLTPSTFKIADPGLYEIIFNIPALTNSYVIVKLNGVQQPETLRWTGSNNGSLSGDVSVRVTTPNSTLQLAVPLGYTASPFFVPNSPLPSTIMIKKVSA
jgi:hypothetical protein